MYDLRELRRPILTIEGPPELRICEYLDVDGAICEHKDESVPRGGERLLKGEQDRGIDDLDLQERDDGNV